MSTVGPMGSPVKGGRLDKEYMQLGKVSGTLPYLLPLSHPLPLLRPLPGAVVGVGDKLLPLLHTLPLPPPRVEEVE